MLYRWILALHIISFISWMAGILYLYRLFVYHAMETEAVVKERFKVMESKLYRLITLPAMLVSFLAGVIMIIMNQTLVLQIWFHAKLFFAVCLIGVTHMAGKTLREFAADECRKSHKFFRIMNEVPTILMILIVLMVILRPF